jgi:transposase
MSGPSITPYFDFARVKVTGQKVHHKGSLIYLEPDLRFRALCHDCGSPAGALHSAGHRRVVRDLDMAGKQVWLQVGYRKVWCPACGKARVEQLDFCEASKRLTRRMARYVYDLCKVMTVSDVAKHLDLDPKTVKAIDKSFLEGEHGQTDLKDLRILAIDEIAVKKGHYYMTVVLDYVTGRVVWMGEGHDKETLDRFFDLMSPQQKAAIQAVTVDMWDPYINRIRHHCPQAKIVFDLFHVVKAFGFVIDEIRRSEYKKADRGEREILKGSRYLLLSNRYNLDHKGRTKLQQVLDVNQTLNAVYVLKDQLKVIYHYVRRGMAKHALDRWCNLGAEIDHPQMAAFIRCLRSHEEGILNHCDFHIGTSALEGVNNKIKVIKRKAYGFHDDEYFALKVKQAFPGKTTSNFLG